MNVAWLKEQSAGQMTAQKFRAFQEKCPDHERWELIDGAPMMMTPPMLAYNRIAGNLTRLLDMALRQHDPSKVALERPGIEIGDDKYRPEPDVVVLDADYGIEQRYVLNAHLLAEVVSPTDLLVVSRTGRLWIDIKADLYRAHAPCQAVLIVSQEQIAVQIDTRTDKGWQSTTLTDPQSELALQDFGLICKLADLYEATPLLPRRRRPSGTTND